MARSALQVGLAVAAALLLVAWVTFALGGFARGGELVKVRFDNVHGLQEGAPVRVRGVEQGLVKELTLDESHRPIATLNMKRGYTIRPGDRIRVVGGLFSLNPPYIEITPGAGLAAAGSTDVLVGESGADQNALMEQASDLVDNLNGLAKQMSRLTGSLSEVTEDRELQLNLKRTAANFADLSASGSRTARRLEAATARLDPLMSTYQSAGSDLSRLAREARGTLSTFRDTGAATQGLLRDARGMVQDTRAVVRQSGELVASTSDVVTRTGLLVDEASRSLEEGRPRLNSVLDTLEGSLRKLDGALTEVRDLVGDDELKNDFRATAANLRGATANLQKISEDVESLTGDPEVQRDLRASLGGLREITQSAGAVLKRAEQVLGTSGQAARSLGARIARTQFRADFLVGGRNSGPRIDVDAILPWTESGFYRLGLFDVGERNRFTVQAGRKLNPRLAARYGFYASRLGVGVDVGDPLHPPFSLELYGIDNPHLDARFNVPIGRGLDLTLGLDQLLRSPDPVIGLRYRR